MGYEDQLEYISCRWVICNFSLSKMLFCCVLLMVISPTLQGQQGNKFKTNIEASGKVTINIFGKKDDQGESPSLKKKSPQRSFNNIPNFFYTEVTTQLEEVDLSGTPENALKRRNHKNDHTREPDVQSDERPSTNNLDSKRVYNKEDKHAKNFEFYENLPNSVYATTASVTISDNEQKSKMIKYLEPILPDDNPIVVLKKLGLSTFAEILHDNNLESVFDKADKYTIFAPTNDAFRNLNNKQKSHLLTNANIKDVASFHVCRGHIYQADIESEDYETMRSDYMTMAISMNTVSVQSASIVSKDIPAKNSLIQVIDKVLFKRHQTLVEVIDSDPAFQLHSYIMRNTSMRNLLQNTFSYTLFLPSADVILANNPNIVGAGNSERELFVRRHIYGPGVLYFENFQDGIIYRMRMMTFDSVPLIIPARRVDRDTLRLNSHVMVTQRDIIAKNGVIHIIDGLL